MALRKSEASDAESAKSTIENRMTQGTVLRAYRDAHVKR